MVQVADCASFLCTLDAFNLLLSAAAGNNCQTTWKQVVTSVTVFNLNNFAWSAEVLNGSGEDQLHDPCLSRICLYVECGLFADSNFRTGVRRLRRIHQLVERSSKGH